LERSDNVAESGHAFAMLKRGYIPPSGHRARKMRRALFSRSHAFCLPPDLGSSFDDEWLAN